MSPSEASAVGLPDDRYAELVEAGEQIPSHQTAVPTVGTLLIHVRPERIEWLWRDRIPLGKVTLLDGDPGLGKSTLLLDIASRVSTGTPMPDESPGMPAGGGVVILSAEDGLADTIRPRLEAADADLARILALEAVPAVDPTDDRMPVIPGDLDVVREAAAEVAARLIIVDPLMAYLDGQVNSHRDQDVRRALAPLARLAEQCELAVVVIRHLNKSGGSNVLYRGGGSIGLMGAARSALLVAADPDDSEARVLAVAKCNLAPTAPSLRFRLRAEDGRASRVCWLGTSGHSAASLLCQPGDVEHMQPVDEARDFLLVELTDGPVPASRVAEDARSAGISVATLRRAKAQLDVRSRKGGFEGWRWELPAFERAHPAR